MNIYISNAIKNGWHHTLNPKLQSQTWESFCHTVVGKQLYLFGIGNGLDIFLSKNQFEIKGVIDNDLNKQGMELSLFHDTSEKLENTIVLNPMVLKMVPTKKCIVLITSLRYFEQIAEQLEELGVKNYFALLPMEAKRIAECNNMKLDIEESDYKNKPIQKNKIVFYTMGNYSGHGKAIAEEIQKRCRDLDIVWIVGRMNIDFPKGIRCVYLKNRNRCLFELSTAKIWVYDDIIPSYINKRSGQIYIQVKHWSSITLKTFGLELAAFRENKVYAATCKHDSNSIDYYFSGSEFDTATFKKGFNYNGKVVEIGSARSDVLFKNTDVRKRIFEQYRIENDKKVILYVPTFRLSKEGEKQMFPSEIPDYERVLCLAKEKYGGEWVLLERFHPNLLERLDLVVKSQNIIDVTNYHDSQELVASADIVITDYSSIMFEPAFVKKPVFLFAPDKEEYINGERELLIPYDTLPFPIAETNEQLAKNIANFNQEEYEKEVTKFLDAYGVHEDGHASERAADFILGLLEKEQ